MTMNQRSGLWKWGAFALAVVTTGCGGTEADWAEDEATAELETVDPASLDRPVTVSERGAGRVERNLRVMQWNVAGGKIHAGSPRGGFTKGVVDMIERTDADFVSLNELCGGQFDSLVAELKRRKWPKDAAHFAHFGRAEAPALTRCRGRWVGNAIFSRRPLGPKQRFELPRHSSSVRDRVMICARLRNLNHLRFCGTHLTHRGGGARQLRTALRQLEKFNDNGDTVIFAGDLNMSPPEAPLDAVYSSRVDTRVNSNNRGKYRELDDRDPICRGHGERTTPRQDGGACGKGPKIDYILARQNRIVKGDYSADTLNIPMCGTKKCSDHRTVQGHIRVSIRL